MLLDFLRHSVYVFTVLGRGVLTNSTYVSGSLQRESSDMLSSQQLMQIAALPSSLFIILHNGWPLVVISGGGKSPQTLSLMKLHYSAVASVLTEDDLIYLGRIKSPADAKTLSATSKRGHILLENSNRSSVAYFCIDLSKLSTDEVVQLGVDAELIHPFSFVQLSSEDRMLYSRASPLLDWHRKNQFCPTCGSVTSMAHGGYKRFCQNTNCLTHKGDIFPFIIRLLQL